MNPRREILALLQGQVPAIPPIFSGLVSITASGMEREGISALAEACTDDIRMARLAASTFRLSGFPAGAVPFDLCLEAEALGAVVDFQGASPFDFPRIPRPPYESIIDLLEALQSGRRHGTIPALGRVPLVSHALAQLKQDIGEHAVVGGILTGPFTILSMLLDSSALFMAMKNQVGLVQEVLSLLSGFISTIGDAYRNAGADLLTVHEMAGSPGFLGPRRFEQLIFSPLRELVANLPAPRVLAVCGNLQGTASLLGRAGADAVSVDQSNDLAALRQHLPGVLLFGNVDPVGTLSFGTMEQVRKARLAAVQGGADSVWPGCDLRLQTPVANLKALLDEFAADALHL